MKKILVLWFVFLSFLWFSSACETAASSNDWLSVEWYNHNFHATLQDDWTVAMTWANFNLPAGHIFKYWKVMRSATNSNPVYRWYYNWIKDELIFFDKNIWFTYYTDNSPKAWVNYYRVCAVTHASDWNHRFCSNNVDKIIVWSSTQSPINSVVVSKPKPQPVLYSNLSQSLKDAVDAMVEKLMLNLDNKFRDNAQDKVLFLETLSKKIGELKVWYKIRPMITYLVQKIDERIALLHVAILLEVN